MKYVKVNAYSNTPSETIQEIEWEATKKWTTLHRPSIKKYVGTYLMTIVTMGVLTGLFYSMDLLFGKLVTFL